MLMLNTDSSRARELVELAFYSAYLKTPAPSAEIIAQVGAEQSVGAGLPGSGLEEIILGCRQLRDVLRDVELEAARQARQGGMTVRELAALTSMSERRANDRYRRHSQ